MALPDPKSLDYSKDGSPWANIDVAGTSATLDYSKDGSPWVGTGGHVAVNYPVAIGQGLACAAIPTRGLVLSRAIAETIAAASVPARVGALTRGIAQGLAAAAVPTRALVLARGIAQGLGVAGVPTRVLALSRAIGESVAAAAAATRGLVLTRAATVALGAALVVGTVGSYSRAAAAGIAVQGAAARTLVLSRAATVAVGIADVVTRTCGRSRAIAEAIYCYMEGATVKMQTFVALSRIRSWTGGIGGRLKQKINELFPDWFRPTPRAAGATVPEPLFWFRADSITTLADGDRVTLWEDKSPNGLDFVSPNVGMQPMWKASIPAAKNQPVVRFDTTNQLMLMDPNPLINPIDTITVVVVMAVRAIPAHEGSILGQGAGIWEPANYGLSFHTAAGITNIRVHTRTNEVTSTLSSVVAITLDEFEVWTVTYRPDPGGIKATLRRNGAEIASEVVAGTQFYGSGPSSFLALGICSFGAYGGTVQDVAEFRLYSVLTDEAYIATLEAELAARYIP